jgi:hypothetical protein
MVALFTIRVSLLLKRFSNDGNIGRVICQQNSYFKRKFQNHGPGKSILNSRVFEIGFILKVYLSEHPVKKYKLSPSLNVSATMPETLTIVLIQGFNRVARKPRTEVPRC